MFKIDRTTFIHSRGKFTRICVEIALSKQLVPKISVLGNKLNIEYEGCHLICFGSGKYNHRADLCPESPRCNDKHQENITDGSKGGAETYQNHEEPEDQSKEIMVILF
ncbi:hypothetical protein Ahy_A07g031545 isoform B [Arachis hypogaea]|nr:hypothetical protein Ahy_A07g031545 isoform B [Arachis hypogaea]